MLYDFADKVSLTRCTKMGVIPFALFIIFSFTLLSALPTAHAQWSNGTSRYFGNEPLPLRITALADWNNCMQTGFFGTLGMNLTNLVWYCRENAYAPYAQCWKSPNFSSPIVSTIVVDLNRDGFLDVLVQCENAVLYFIDGKNRDNTPFVIQQGVPSFDGSVPQISLASVFSLCGLPDIALVDQDGSLVILKGTTYTDGEEECRGSGAPTFQPVVLVQGIKNEWEVVPLSLASDDINGDCGVELLYMVHNMSSNTLEVYSFFSSEERHELLIKLDAAGHYGIPSFADVNGDGAPDLSIPTCADTNGSLRFGECTLFNGIVVFYNTLHGTQPCSRNGCCQGHPYGFTSQFSKSFSLSTPNACGVGNSINATPLAMPNSVSSPLLLRFADYNRDGHVDFVVPSTRGPLLITGRGSAGDAKVSPFLCSLLDVSAAFANTGALSAYIHAVPFFANVADRERYDVVLTHHTLHTLPLSVYLNNAVPNQYYFLASSSLNGVANVDAWGVYQPAAVHRFSWTDLSMNAHWAYAAQVSKSQGHALQPPLVLLGLGRTFSYVQDYAVGIITNSVVKRRLWSVYLVPDSKVLTWLHPLLAPDKWRLQLYIAFSTYKKLLLIVLATVLSLIGIPIVFLKLREVRQDRREWKLR